MSAKGREVDRFLQGKAYKASIQGISKKGTYNTNERRYNPLDWALLSPPATDADHEQAIKPLAETFAIIAAVSRRSSRASVSTVTCGCPVHGG